MSRLSEVITLLVGSYYHIKFDCYSYASFQFKPSSSSVCFKVRCTVFVTVGILVCSCFEQHIEVLKSSPQNV